MRRALLLLATATLALTAIGCGRSEPRPAGITERWLQAVSELGREGLRADAEERAAEYGTPEATAKVRPADAEDDERTFSDLEVGKAVVDVDQARVPFRLTARIEGGGRRQSDGAAVLVKEDGTWRVIDVVPREPGEKVPSEGGERPARAAASHWLYAIAASGVITLIGVVLIEREGERTN
ncbi:MAG: hypothetical protein KY443_03495 [Actinobacteria bacterium]|nr:hypothetical protein [Actinomycetota bacterium]